MPKESEYETNLMQLNIKLFNVCYFQHLHVLFVLTNAYEQEFTLIRICRQIIIFIILSYLSLLNVTQKHIAPNTDLSLSNIESSFQTLFYFYENQNYISTTEYNITLIKPHLSILLPFWNAS